MMKILIKKSALQGFDNAKLAKLKAEVIEILKKKDSQEYKKAIEYFSQDELKYTHLEKSLSGEWLEKAGYGVGTVRIWKGKKYKKVAPSKWVRVFDKEDRGAKSSMTRLINAVKNCPNAEELYKFCLSNHSLFQDDNGVDLPIMDKLRAAIDDQKKKVGDELDGSKHFQKPVYKNSQAKEPEKTEKENNEQKKYDKLLKEFKDDIASGKRNNTKELEEDVKEWKHFVASEMSYRKEHNGESGGFSDAHIKHIQNCIKVGEAELKKRAEKTPESKENFSKVMLTRSYNAIMQRSGFEKIDETIEKIKKQIADNPDSKEMKARLVVAEKIQGLGDNAKAYESVSDAIETGTFDELGKDSKVLSNGKTIKEVREKYGITTDSESKERIEKYKKEFSESENDFYFKKEVQEVKRLNHLLDVARKAENDSVIKDTENFLKLHEKYRDEYKQARDELRKESEAEKHQNRSDGKDYTKDDFNKPKENDPKVLAGIDFVNKNKMHVLANYLANHDNVNMATATVRLQQAYEKLGEENFLSHFPKDIVEKYRKESGNVEKKTSEPKKDVKSMSDEELDAYEKKLEKESLAMDKKDPGYIDKYNQWREAHTENNERFHARIDAENKAEQEKQNAEKEQRKAERKAKVEKKEAAGTMIRKIGDAIGNENVEVKHSGSTLKVMDKDGHLLKMLRDVQKQGNFSPRQNWDLHEKAGKLGINTGSFRSKILLKDGNYYVLDNSKLYTLEDYVKKDVKKSIFADLLSDFDCELIDEDEEDSDYSDYDASQPELFNSTQYKVADALNSVFGC